MVKNEADIIESFVRYNLNILDGMIILDNCSSDNTLEILNLLKKEGLNLYIIKDDDMDFDQTIKTNKLLSQAVTEFNPDIIVPLDADEFIIASKNQNPRKYLEMIEFPEYLSVKWKTYVPTFDNEDEKFIPSKITFAREDLGEYRKVILPKELFESYDVKLTKGNHKLSFNAKYEDFIKNKSDKNLRIAHFPIRSKEQFISKIIVGWINNLIDVNRSPYESWHLKNIYNDLKNDLTINEKDMIDFAKNYSMEESGKKVGIAYDPMDLSFCKDISIKYEINELNYFTKFLSNTESLAQSHLNLKKDIQNEEKGFEEEINLLKREINRFKSDNDNLLIKVDRITNQKILLEKKIEEYETSTSWRITAPLRKLISLLKT